MTSSAGITWPYLRRIEVKFSNIPQPFASTGRQAAENGKDNARITVRIEKAIQGISTANVTLYNLSPDTRTMFQRDTTKVEVKAGWERGIGPEPSRCFYGSLFTAQHNRSGPDIVTTIHAMSMIGDLAKTEIRKPWGQGYPVRNIVIDLANELAKGGNIEVDEKRIVGINKVVGKKCWAHAGAARDALDNLGREHGFSWTVIDGKFQAIADDKNLGGTTTVKEPYLIDVNPVLTGVQQIATGLRVRCMFNADLDPGRNITVQSKLSRFSGQPYRINRTAHSLDCFSANSFISDVTAFLPPSAENF
jgi:hypothetical protein